MDGRCTGTRTRSTSGEVPQMHALILRVDFGNLQCIASDRSESSAGSCGSRSPAKNTYAWNFVLEAQLHHRVLSRLWNIRDRYGTAQYMRLMLLPVDAAAIISHNVRYHTSSICLETQQHARLPHQYSYVLCARDSVVRNITFHSKQPCLLFLRRSTNVQSRSR